MILEQQKQAQVFTEGEESQESIGMSLDLDSAQILMQMLSKNLYSDPIGSTIRECASNALDSHRRAGTTDPIVVSFKKNKDDNYEFSVEDFGIGLDAEDVKNIISKYGKSTKRNSDTELGMMGLGFKAPLAYCSSFYFVARKNGMERKYMMYEGEDVNTIDLLHEAPTTERNGVKVIVPVDYSDRGTFVNKIAEQLCYFDSVYFDVPPLGYYNSTKLDNSHKIHRHELFQYSTLVDESNGMHLCLDNVYYPIDFKKLGIDEIRLPIGLRFGLSDGIFPTPNRESIRYTTECKEAIINRIKQVADYLMDQYNDIIGETDNPINIMDYYSNNSRKVEVAGKNLNVKEVENFSSKQFKSPKLIGYTYLNADFIRINRGYLEDEYELKAISSYGKFSETGYLGSVKYNQGPNCDVYLLPEGQRISSNTRNYIRSLTNSNRNKKIVLIKKRPILPLKHATKDNYVDMLSLKQHPKSEWRDRIKEYQKLTEALGKNYTSFSNFVIPQSWIDAQKQKQVRISKQNKGRKMQGEVVGKVLEGLERFVQGKNSKLVPRNIPLENAHKNKIVTVYGESKWFSVMDKFFMAFNTNKVRFVIFSERELKLLKDLDVHNWIKMEDFMKGEHMLFRRVATAKLINMLIDDNRSLFNNPEAIKGVSDELYTDLQTLINYNSKHHTSASSDCYEAILEVAKAHNYYDTTIIDTYNKMKQFLDKFRFIDALVGAMRYNNPHRKQIIIDLLKYHKQKLNWKNYKINEEVVTPVQELQVEDII